MTPCPGPRAVVSEAERLLRGDWICIMVCCLSFVTIRARIRKRRPVPPGQRIGTAPVVLGASVQDSIAADGKAAFGDEAPLEALHVDEWMPSFADVLVAAATGPPALADAGVLNPEFSPDLTGYVAAAVDSPGALIIAVSTSRQWPRSDARIRQTGAKHGDQREWWRVALREVLL